MPFAQHMRLPLLLVAACLASCAQPGTRTTPTTPVAPATPTTPATHAPGRTQQPQQQQVQRAWQSPLHRDHPLVGRVFEIPGGREISPAALATALAPADVVILGEKHDNPDHHLLQAETIAALARHRPVHALVFEQLRLPQQAVIDALAPLSAAEVDRLEAPLAWNDSGWPPWAQYRPVFEAGLRAGATLRAGSPTSQTTMAAAQQGVVALPAPLVARFALDQAPAPPDADLLRAEMQQSHCGMLPDAMLDGMVLVQRVRDATLAEAILDSGPRGAVLIAGNGHARNDRGVPHYLRMTEVQAVRSVGLIEVQPGRTHAADYASDFGTENPPFDYVWFTPVANATDHCAELRARFGHGQHAQ